MKIVKVVFFLLVVLAGCDEREKYIKELNDLPVIGFGKLDAGAVLLKDSMKMGLKSGQKYYELSLRVTDKNNNIVSVLTSWQSGEGTISQDGNLVGAGGLLIPAEGIVNLRIVPKSLALNRIAFVVTDKLNATGRADLELMSFNNLAPVARYSLKSLAVIDPLEYEIDASKSFDRDAKFGGTVERYYFYVNDVEIAVRSAAQPKLKWIFEDKRQYKITVKVQDSDGAYGEVSGTETIR